MKEIELTQGFKALVDDCDYDLVSQYEWHADMKSGYPYAMTNIYLPNGKRTRISMHRLIMGCSYGDGKIVDHKNRDTTNNTRENLRICTHSQNCTNAIGKGSSCGYKGVCYLPKRNQYYVDINNKGKRKYIGIYSNAEDAAYAYNEAAKKYYGEFAWLNNF